MGECPRWHGTEDRLYWIDMLGGPMYRYDPATDESEQVYEGDNVGGLTIRADGSLLLFMEGGSVRSFADGSVEILTDGVPGESGVRFHDAIADPSGRVFCGTIGTEQAPSRLYRLDRDGSFTVLLDERNVVNGVDFSPDCSTLYVADTGENRVDAFAYDETTGQIDDEATFIDIPDDDGSPDGLTVDAEGHVWVAHMGAASLVRYDPDGQETHRVTFPTETVTAARFGGTNRSDLYVTTGDGDGNPDADNPAGAVFCLNPPAAGSETYRSDVDFS